MRRTLISRATLPVVLFAAGAVAPQSSPEEAGVWLKLFGVVAETPAPVVLTEAEVNLLLASAQITALLGDGAGVSRLEVRLLPDEVRLSGDLDAARLDAAMGALAPPTTASAHPVEASIRLRGASGSGEAEVLRGSVSGRELPPEFFSGILLATLVRAFRNGTAGSDAPVRAGSPFPLPWGLDGIEVGTGEIRLIPGAR